MPTRSYIFAVCAVLLALAAVGYEVLRDKPAPVSTVVTPVVPPAVLPPPPAVPTETPTTSSSSEEMILVDSPTANSIIKSPLTVSGRAKGNWYFEASFPVVLVDASGTVIAQTPAQAQGEWMTENFVPFTATLTWASTSTTATSGILILKRDNPSGLPENDKSIKMPVSF